MIARNGDRLQVSGNLTMETVTTLYNADLRANGGGALTIDLAQVETVDSAAVSLLLSWQRRAQRDNMNLCFANLPPNLVSLARMYGVDGMLPLASSAQS
jgi:phospholipid transport system transporter-binding protein